MCRLIYWYFHRLDLPCMLYRVCVYRLFNPFIWVCLCEKFCEKKFIFGWHKFSVSSQLCVAHMYMVLRYALDTDSLSLSLTLPSYHKLMAMNLNDNKTYTHTLMRINCPFIRLLVAWLFFLFISPTRLSVNIFLPIEWFVRPLILASIKSIHLSTFEIHSLICWCCLCCKFFSFIYFLSHTQCEKTYVVDLWLIGFLLLFIYFLSYVALQLLQDLNWL